LKETTKQGPYLAAQEDKDKSVIDDIKERLLSKFDEINNNEITRNYIESKEKLDRLIKKVNEALSVR